MSRKILTIAALFAGTFYIYRLRYLELRNLSIEGFIK
jgi:hypothetical protein